KKPSRSDVGGTLLTENRRYNPGKLRSAPGFPARGSLVSLVTPRSGSF
ncbi:uncharacterized protein PgNI_04146, partial [Pyricularia grisea]|uniref:Uncharacterized protein n=1 Tax=Pyricularia grisea TaxID=148305 RepID=A0A6P8BAI1_PYRGI